MKNRIYTTSYLLAFLPVSFISNAAEKANAPKETAPQASQDEMQRVNVESVKEKYWARGDESELGVVQNRLYSKAQKWELGLGIGITSTDPFLSVKTFGGTFGFHFNEYFSAHLMGSKHSVSSSNANDVLEAGGKKANTNKPKDHIGLEGRASLLYGKLSVVGKQIVYYDFHFLLGAGGTNTETGRYFTPHTGLGQQIFLSKRMSFNVDYRIMRYNDRAREKTITSKLGQLTEERTNWAHNVAFGISFFIGGDK